MRVARCSTSTISLSPGDSFCLDASSRSALLPVQSLLPSGLFPPPQHMTGHDPFTPPCCCVMREYLSMAPIARPAFTIQTAVSDGFGNICSADRPHSRSSCAGKVMDSDARTIVTTPSSSGCRKTVKTWRRNSGSSSRQSTPWRARDTSPGMGSWAPAALPATAPAFG